MPNSCVLRQSLGLLSWLLICFAVSALGALASIEARDFYATLVQPSWSPPGWVFGPVWTTLYTLMAVAAWLVWRSGGIAEQRLALGLFLVQLAFNALWSWLFFAWQLGGIAFLEVMLLWGLILATLMLFWRANRWAGLLLLPYLGWVSFAVSLNFSLWQLNPTLL